MQLVQRIGNYLCRFAINTNGALHLLHNINPS